MNASRLFAFVATLTLIVACLFTRTAGAGEILDNEKLLEMIKEGVSLKVILAKIQSDPKDCHFVSGFKDTIAIQKACNSASWTPADTDTIQTKVNDLAAQGLKDLKNLVNLFLTSADNDDENQNPQQYVELLHRLVRAGTTVVPFLRDNLSQESERKRVGVLIALASIGDKTADMLKECVMLLDDPSKPVRAQAAKTVAVLKGADTGELLITMLNRRDKKNDGVALALGYMRYEPAIEPLVQVLKTSREADDKVCAAFSLGEMRAKTFGAPDALLLGILDDKDENLREVCARACALIGERRAPLYITKAFDRFRPGRKKIIDVLAYFKSTHGARFLAEQLENDDNEIRKIAMKTLEVLLTGEHYETKEQWLSYIELLSLRPEWQEPKESGKLPDLQEK